MKRVLITGPTASASEYSDAARRAGWEPVELALTAVSELPLELERALPAAAQFDWICITSSAALPFLERACAARPALRATPLAFVGARTGERLRTLGLDARLGPARDAEELAELVLGTARPRSRILWPHGDRSDELARALRAHPAQHALTDLVVYQTRPLTVGDWPAVDVVFFASPSAVRAWHDAHPPNAPRSAIAIGQTTLVALNDEPELAFESITALANPSPDAFEEELRHQSRSHEQS
jgi:uroporphyrinogen-III synthase